MSLFHPTRFRFASRLVAVAVLAALGATALPAQAETLMQAYQQALQSDPVLKQASDQDRITAEGVAQSRAVLLPQINGSVNFSDSHGSSGGSMLVDTTTGPAFIDTTGHSAGRSRSESVGLNQVLFDLGRFADLRASKAAAAAGAAQYRAAQQNLILRVAQAYFTVLSDEAQLQFAEANEKALQKQLDQVEAKKAAGLAAVTDVVDAKAQHDSAVAQVIEAKNTVFNDRQALAEITGQPVGQLDPLTDNLPLTPPVPDAMDAWVKTALASNPSLAAQREQLASSQHDVTAAYAGHLPTLNATVSYSRNPTWRNGTAGDLASIGNPAVTAVQRVDGRSNDTVVGLVLSVPLFSGGATQSRVRQAIAQRDLTRDTLEQDRRSVVSNTRNAFNAIEAGISSAQAQKQAVLSAKTALDATQIGYQIGTRNIVDLLLSQQTYFQAQSAYSQARHALVINRLNLKAAAGTLTVQDLEAVNRMLQ